MRTWLAALTAVLVSLAASAEYPERPIRLIVPFAPGGVTDTSGRLVAEARGKRLGQLIVVGVTKPAVISW
jgi:tripartite-type tricarboxylate transporter receptor subunit TctC